MSKEEINLTHNVEKGDGINVNRGSGKCRDWNGIQYKTGMSSKMSVQKNSPWMSRPLK